MLKNQVLLEDVSMTYNYCPYCNASIGAEKKASLGVPLIKCRRCGRMYSDSRVYEWAVISPIYKAKYIFADKLRCAMYLFILGYSLQTESKAMFFFLSALWALICYLWFAFRHRSDIQESICRVTKSKEYVMALLKSEYPMLSKKKCVFYWNDLKQIANDRLF